MVGVQKLRSGCGSTLVPLVARVATIIENTASIGFHRLPSRAGVSLSDDGGDFFVENVMEELDFPGEFFFEKRSLRHHEVKCGPSKEIDIDKRLTNVAVGSRVNVRVTLFGVLESMCPRGVGTCSCFTGRNLNDR